MEDIKTIVESSLPYLTLGAFIVSIWAVRSVINSNNKQIKVDKIEEIYEITLFLFKNYEGLKGLYLSLKDHSENGATQQLWDNYIVRLGSFQSNVDISILAEKPYRLKVLANAYLKGDVRKKVLAYNDLFEKLMMISLNRSLMHQGMFYKEGFPDILDLHKYLEDLQDEFIKLIGMSKGFITAQGLRKYIDDIFKYDIKVKR